jgi:hypothetical protein
MQKMKFPIPVYQKILPNPVWKTWKRQRRPRKPRMSKRKVAKRTSILEDAWNVVSGKSGADSQLSSVGNDILSDGATSVNYKNTKYNTRQQSKNLVKTILIEGNEDDGCKQCTKNQKEKVVRWDRHSKSDSLRSSTDASSKQTWQSSVVASSSSKNKPTVPKVRLKISNSCPEAVIVSDEDEIVSNAMETSCDTPDVDNDGAIEVGICGSDQEIGTGPAGDENDDACDTRGKKIYDSPRNKLILYKPRLLRKRGSSLIFCCA